MLLDRDQLEEVLARRRAWGADKLDEVWEGVPHLGQQVGRHPGLQQRLALLLGGAAEERGLVAVLGAYEPCPPGSPSGASGVRVPGDSAGTAPLAVEIVDADDCEERLSMLAADRIDEVVLVDLGARTVRWLALADGEYRPTAASRLIDVRPAALAESITWPSDPTGRHRQLRASTSPVLLLVRIPPVKAFVSAFVDAAYPAPGMALAKREHHEVRPFLVRPRREDETERALRRRRIRDRHVQLELARQPGPVRARLDAAQHITDRDAEPLQAGTLAFGSDPPGRASLQALDLIAPDTRTDPHGHTDLAAAPCSQGHPSPSAGTSPKYCSNSSLVRGRPPNSAKTSSALLVIAGSSVTPPSLSETTS